MQDKNPENVNESVNRVRAALHAIIRDHHDGLDAVKRVCQVSTDLLAVDGAIHRRAVLTEPLQTALNNRIAIEQAKGIITYATNLTIDQAFQALRAYSRNNKEVTERRISPPAPHNGILSPLVRSSSRPAPAVSSSQCEEYPGDVKAERPACAQLADQRFPTATNGGPPQLTRPHRQGGRHVPSSRRGALFRGAIDDRDDSSSRGCVCTTKET